MTVLHRHLQEVFIHHLQHLLMVAVLYVLGVASIREFALPIMVGIIAGGYSSVFITGSLWYMLSKNKYGKKTDDNKNAAKKKTK